MEIDVTFDGIIRLRKVFKPIILENEEGEQIRIKMVDGGFQIDNEQDASVVVNAYREE
jgi:hypothetical protein